MRLPLPRSRVPSALPTKPANALVALAEVLGSGNVAIPATQTSITLGERAWKPAKVSSLVIEIEQFRVLAGRQGERWFLLFVIYKTSTYAQEQPRQPLLQLLLPRPRVPSALLTMPAKSLVALAEVLGSGIVAIPTQTSITLGERA